MDSEKTVDSISLSSRRIGDLQRARDSMLSFCEKFNALSESARSKYVVGTEVDPLMVEVVRLGAQTIDRAISTAATFSTYRHRRSGEWDPDGPAYSSQKKADETILLSKLSGGDLRFLVFLDEYFGAASPPKVIEYFDSYHRKPATIPVSPERAAQIDAFKALASDVQNLSGIRELVRFAQKELDQPRTSRSGGRA